MKRSKRMKRLAVLFGIFVVACGITIGVVKYEEKKEQIKNSDEIILQISPETVTALSWENETESLAFHKDGTWLYDADEAFPVDEDAVNELLSLFEEFGVSFVIDDVEDFSQYGLDDPVCTIHITTTEQLEDVKTAEELAAEEMETDEAEGGENSETDEEPQADEPASSAAAEDETSEVGETNAPSEVEETPNAEEDAAGTSNEGVEDAAAAEDETSEVGETSALSEVEETPSTEEDAAGTSNEGVEDAAAAEDETSEVGETSALSEVEETPGAEESVTGTGDSGEEEDQLLEETNTDQAIEEETQADENSATAGYTYEIRLGNFSVMDSQRYVSIGDGKVYLVSNDPLDLYDAVLSDMIDHDEIPLFENITDICFEGIENYEIAYEQESANTYCPSDVYFAQIDGASLPLDTDLTEEYVSNISLISLTNYVNYKVAEEELADYGLDTPELTVTIDYTYAGDGDDEETISDTFVMHIGRNQEEVKAAEEAAQKAEEEGNADYEPEDIPAYVRIGNSQIIYEISNSDYEKLVAVTYNDLRHKEVFTADFGDVYQVDISLEGVNYTLTSAAAEENAEETIWYYGEDELAISSFQSALANLNAVEFTDEAPSEKEEISLTVYLNNENHPQVEIHLYRYDGNNCLAEVDGESFALIARSEVVELMEAVNAIVLKKS